MPESCSTCRFARTTGITRGLATLVVECRRHAPSIEHNKASWPEVELSHWCGEYEAREEAKPAEAKPAERQDHGFTAYTGGITEAELKTRLDNATGEAWIVEKRWNSVMAWLNGGPAYVMNTNGMVIPEQAVDHFLRLYTKPKEKIDG